MKTTATQHRRIVESGAGVLDVAAWNAAHPDQLKDAEGKWTDGDPDVDVEIPDVDEDDAGSVSAFDEVSVYGGRSVAGSHMVAFDDPGGAYLPGGGRGVAFRDEEILGEIEDGNDIDESTRLPLSDVEPVATALDAAWEAATDHDGTDDPRGGGPVLIEAWNAQGLHIAAFHDVDGTWGQPGDPVVALSFGQLDEAPWGDLSQAHRYFDLYEPGAAAELSDSLREVAQAQPRMKQGIDPKLDKLRLDGRIELPAGQSLAGSAKLKDSQGQEIGLALSQSGDGPHLRLGFLSGEDGAARRWAGEGDSEYVDGLLFDPAGVAQLRQNAAGLADEATQMQKVYRAFLKEVDAFGGLDDDAHTYNSDDGWVDGEWNDDAAYRFRPGFTPEQQEKIKRAVGMLNSDFPVAQGVLASGPWGELRYEVTPQSEFDGDWGGRGETVDVDLSLRRPGESEDHYIGDSYTLKGVAGARQWSKALLAVLALGDGGVSGDGRSARGHVRAAGLQVKAAGLAVLARDTGRVLMLQRALDDDDPASGTWEFPGGCLDEGEDPLEAAKREWSEETGCEVPDGQLIGKWHAGVYCGYVWQVAGEADVPVFDGRSDVTNPDDPDGDQVEALAWWDRSQLTGSNPGLREELRHAMSKVHSAFAGFHSEQAVGLGAVRGWSADTFDESKVDRDRKGKFSGMAGLGSRAGQAIVAFFKSPTYRKISTGGHIALDVIGLAPIYGEPVDLANAAWYLAERKPKDAFLSLGSAVPGLGYVTATAKALKHIRKVRRLIETKRAAKAAVEVAEAAARAARTALGVPLNGGHDAELLEQMRRRWGTDPRPWAVLHAHLTRRVGEARADQITANWFVRANGEDSIDDAPAGSSAARGRLSAGELAAYIVDGLVGGSYTPQQRHAREQWLDRSRWQREAAMLDRAAMTVGDWRERGQLQRSDYYNIRWPKGSKVNGKAVGGQFMDVGGALEDLMNGVGDDDPLDAFDVPKLKAAAAALGVAVPPQADKAQLKRLLHAKAVADVKAQREENLAAAGAGQGTPFTPAVGTRRDMPGGYIVRERAPGTKGESGRWSLDGTKWIANDREPADVWAVHQDDGTLVGHVMVPSEARDLLDAVGRTGGAPTGTRTQLGQGAYAVWDGQAWAVHTSRQIINGVTFDGDLVGSTDSIGQARDLAAEAMAKRPKPKYRDGFQLPKGGPVRPEYTGPKMTIKPVGRKLTEKERIEQAFAEGHITAETARRLLKGETAQPPKIDPDAGFAFARALAMAGRIIEQAQSGDEAALRKFLARQNTKTLRYAAHILGIKKDESNHAGVVEAITAHTMAAQKPKSAQLVASRGKPLDAKDVAARLLATASAGRRNLLAGLKMNQTQARKLARDFGVKGTSRLKLNEVLDRIGAHFDLPDQPTPKGRDLLANAELDIAGLASVVRKGNATTGAGGYDDRGADEALASIARLQEFDQPPQVVSREQLDARIAAGDLELFRRVKPFGEMPAAELAEQFRSGPVYYGRGEWANGIHATANAERVTKYGPPEGALRMALRADARTVTIEQLRQARRERQDHTNWPQDDIVLFQDLGRLAAALGYDAIEPDNDPRSPWILLNRGAVTVEEAGPPSRALWPVSWQRFDPGQPRDPGGQNGGQWVDTGKVFDTAGGFLGYTEEAIYRNHGLTVHRVDFGDDDDLHVSLHEPGDITITADLPHIRGGPQPDGRSVAHVTDPDNAKDLAAKIRWADDAYSELDEDEINELLENYDKTSGATVDQLVEYDRTDDGVIVGYDPYEEGVVLYFPKEGVDKPREDHLGEDYVAFALQTDNAIAMADALQEIADFEPEQLESYSAGGRWDLYLWNDFQITVSDDGGDSAAATLSRTQAEALLDDLIDMRDGGAGSVGAAEVTRKAAGLTAASKSDGSVDVAAEFSGEHMFTVPAGDLDNMIDALDEATDEARRTGGYTHVWDMDKERAWHGQTRADGHWQSQPRDPGGADGGRWVKAPMSLAKVVDKFGELADEVDLGEGSYRIQAHDSGTVVLALGGGDNDKRTVVATLTSDEAQRNAEAIDDMVSDADDYEPDPDDGDVTATTVVDKRDLQFGEDRGLAGYDGSGQMFVDLPDRDRHEFDDTVEARSIADALREMADVASDAADRRQQREENEREEIEEREELERQEREEREEREREEREKAESWWDDVSVRVGDNGIIMSGPSDVELSDHAHGVQWASVFASDLPVLAKALRALKKRGDELPEFEYDVDEDGEEIEPDVVDTIDISETHFLKLLENREIQLDEHKYVVDMPLWRKTAEALADELDKLYTQWVGAPKPQPSRSAALMAMSIVDALAAGGYTAEQMQARRQWLRKAAVADRPKAPRAPRGLAAIKAIKANYGARPGEGVPFKLNDQGQAIDIYGQFADLPDVPAKPAKAAKAAPKPAATGKRPRADAGVAIAALEVLREDKPTDARQQTRQILAGLSGPQLKEVAAHFGVELHGRLIADKRDNLERVVVGVRSDHQAIMDWRAANKPDAPAASKGVADEPLRPDGATALAQVPAGGVRPDDGSDSVLHEAGPGDRGKGRRPRRPAGAAGADGSALRDQDGSDDGRPVAGAAGGAGGDAAEGGGRRDRRVDAVVFRPQGQDDLAPATEKKRLAANIEALRTLRTIQADDRAATAPEQAKLARWSGWGSLPGIFKEPPQDNTYGLAQEVLKQLLSPGEYAAARRTTRNAHYTDAGYVRAIWDAMRDLGFEGGEVLEPGSGSGTFMGMVPEGIAKDTHVTGVELDPITAGIARALYPNQDVRAESFADTKTDDGAFDLAIGNVPFSDTKLVDREYNPGRRHNMHNHFILKTLRMTRPGGLAAVITSRYTMDSLSPEARKEMAELGDLVGAVRLPSGAHERAAGTAVVTDLLVFRRREPGTPYGGAPFEQTRTIKVDGKDMAVNEFFVDSGGNATDMVLGQLGALHGMRGKDDLTVKGDKNAEPALRAALAKLVAQAKADAMTQTPGRRRRPAFAATGQARKPDGYMQVRADGTFTRLVRGVEQPHTVPVAQGDELRQLLRLRDSVMALVDAESSNVDDDGQLVRLREGLNDVYDAYVAKYGPVSRFTETRSKGSDEDEDDIEEKRVTRRRPPQGGFRSDPYSAAVRSLEIYDPATNTARKSDIFRRRAISPRSPKSAAENPADALAITLDQAGEVDLDYVAELLGLDDDVAARQALGSLVFDEPVTGRVVPRPEYLSGNVREKLGAARIAAAADPAFDANVEALQRALPPDLTPVEIRAKMGAGWVNPRYVQQFLREILRDKTLTVRRVHGSEWKVKSQRKTTTAATTEWGTRDRNAVELAEDILSQRPIRVSVDGTPSQEKTEAAQGKAREIAERFEGWAWEDPTRARDLQDTYNRMFNSLVLRTYDGAELSLPGLSRDGFYPYPHRFAAISRIINEPSVGLWHEVGAGKTTVMIIGGMEMRRLGLVQKPAYVVPNHMLDQFTSEFLERYPQARVLAVGADDLKNDKNGQKRREIIARAATGDWDAVILTQGAFKRIPVSSDTEKAYLEAEAEPLRRSVARRRAEVELEVRAANPELNQSQIAVLVKAGLEKDPTVKELEGLVEKAEERIKEHLGTVDRDPGMTWEQTGIDYLFVDEAHTYKNLRTPSRVQGMGIPGSAIATDLHMKLHHLRSRYDRVATLATATPIANSVAEAYTMMRYVRPDLMEEMGVDTFDDFAANFGQIVSRLEVAPTGGLRQHSRFARFVNVPELLRPWLIASDVKTADDLKGIVKVPDLAERVDADGGRTRTPEIEVVPPSEEFKEHMASLVERAKNIPYPPEKGGDNMLRITGEGRAAALDLNMVGLATSEPQKLDRAADRIAGIYQENKDRVYNNRDGNPQGTPGALQLVFSDIGTPAGRKAKRAKGKSAQAAGGEPMLAADQTGYFPEDVDLADFDAYNALRDKLVARGIPKSKIRFIHDAKTDQEKAELFAAARDGRIAVLVGSTAKMGVGTNVQDRAVALHHLDAPWRPADVQQREGRIIRQGNKNPEVRVIRYVTEQSFDAYIWQAITTKGTFINQLMKGRLDVREMDDVGDFSLSAAEVTALGTGNRWLIQHADAQAELTRLERAARNHEADQRNLAKQIAVSEADIATSQRLIGEIDQALTTRVDTRGDAFSMRLGDETYTNRTNAQDRLRHLLQRIARREQTTATLGQFGGFPLRATATDYGVRIELVGVPGADITAISSELETGDIIGKLQYPLSNLETSRSRHVSKVGEARRDIESLRSRQGKPFRDADDLTAARQRFERIESQLKAELASRGETVQAADPAAKAAAAKAAELAGIRGRLAAGEGFRGIGELTTWLESDPELANKIPDNAGAKWGVMSPRGQLVVQKGPGSGYLLTIPRTMQTMPAMRDLRTQADAKAFAAALDNSAIPWNTGADLAAWRAPDGADVAEVVARLRGEHPAWDKNGTWKEYAQRAQIQRSVPKRLHKQLLEGQYRHDGLGLANFARIEPKDRDAILAILRTSGRDGDLAAAARLRDLGMAQDHSYTVQNFVFAAADRLAADYRREHPQPLDDVRKQFQKDFERLDPQNRDTARIEQILADADADANLAAASVKLRTMADELTADRYPSYYRRLSIALARLLADVLDQHAERDGQFAGWTDPELRALLAQHRLPTDGDRAALMARLSGGGITVSAPATAADLDLAGARSHRVEQAGTRMLPTASDRPQPAPRVSASTARTLLAAFERSGNHRLPTAHQPAISQQSARQLLGALTRKFDLKDHPRWGAGTPGGKGGEFRPDIDGGGAGPLSDHEFESRQHKVGSVMSQAFGTHATHKQFADGNGAWHPQRDALHRQIAVDLYARAANVPRQGRAVFSGGLPGAGKTTVLSKHAGIDLSDYFVISADDVKEELAKRGLVPEVPGHPDLSPMERTVLVHEESRRIANLTADMAYRDKRNVIWDFTMGAPEEVQTRVEAMRAHGYTDISGILVEIPIETSIQRALSRYREGVDAHRAGKGLGGRYLPPSVVHSYRSPTGSTINRDAFDATRHLLDDWSIFDNSVHGRKPILIGKKEGS